MNHLGVGKIPHHSNIYCEPSPNKNKHTTDLFEWLFFPMLSRSLKPNTKTMISKQ